MNPKLQEAIESDCGHGVCALLKEKDASNVIELLDVVANRDSYTERAFLNAIYILGRWGDERAVPLITQELPDLDERGKICALDALGRIGKDVDVEEIAKAGESENPDVRKFAIRALARIGTVEARQKLDELDIKEKIPWLKDVAQKSIRNLSQPRH